MPTLWVEHPFLVPLWGPPELRRVADALLSQPGREVAAFEQEFAEFIGGRQGTATGSGRLALELALREVGVRRDWEVIVPTFGCGALVAAVRRSGATPVFADVGEDLNLTADTVRAAMTPQTRVIIVVHTGGRRAPVAKIAALAREHEVVLIEDCAQATGGRSMGIPWGSVGRSAVYSFGMGKNVMASAGGFVTGVAARLPREGSVTAVRRIAGVLWAYRFRRLTRPLAIALEMRTRGSAPEDRSDPYPVVRMSDVDASIMRAQLQRLDSVLSARRTNAMTLLEELDGEPSLELPDPTEHLFTKFYIQIRLARRPPLGRWSPELQGLVRTLLRSGFEPELPYTPLHLRFGGQTSRCPVSEDRYWRTLTLPVRPGITAADSRRLAQVVRRYVRTLRGG